MIYNIKIEKVFLSNFFKKELSLPYDVAVIYIIQTKVAYNIFQQAILNQMAL